MPTYHTQPSPTWRDRFTERELRLIANARTYAENDPAACRATTCACLSPGQERRYRPGSPVGIPGVC